MASADEPTETVAGIPLETRLLDGLSGVWCERLADAGITTLEQLVRLGRSADLRVYEHDGSAAPLDIVSSGISEARKSGFDTVLVDTAGRLHIDEPLMDELRGLKGAYEPGEILFVADAMTGQDAVRSAGEFHEALGLTVAPLLAKARAAFRDVHLTANTINAGAPTRGA